MIDEFVSAEKHLLRSWCRNLLHPKVEKICQVTIQQSQHGCKLKLFQTKLIFKNNTINWFEPEVSAYCTTKIIEAI